MSAGEEIGLDAALIEAFRMGLEQGLNAGLSAAAAAFIVHERKRKESCAADPTSFEAAAAGYHATASDAERVAAAARLATFRRQVERRSEMFVQDEAARGFFKGAEQLVLSRGFRRLSVRYMVLKGDDELRYEVDGDVNLTDL